MATTINMHTGAEIGSDEFQPGRASGTRYRTTPLTDQKAGFFHDRRFGTLPDVTDRYDGVFRPSLTQHEKNDLVELLKSL